MSEAPLHPLAQASNDALSKDCPIVLQLLSARGKRFFFPAKGILAQGGEAKQKAKVANATVGIATENGAPMHLACVNRYYQGLTPAEIYDYAPSYGKPDLRAAWAKKQRAETPSLGDHPISNPVVTNALTHGLGLVGDLFLDPGDPVLTSDLMWENYNLNWETRLEARFDYFPFFDEKLTGFNLAGSRPAWPGTAGRSWSSRSTSRTTRPATRRRARRRTPSRRLTRLSAKSGGMGLTAARTSAARRCNECPRHRRSASSWAATRTCPRCRRRARSSPNSPCHSRSGSARRTERRTGWPATRARPSAVDRSRDHSMLRVWMSKHAILPW